ncbi:hypothetical protein EJB05_24550 [Eragrostis curvula]|uniref:Uncharacterized protein n=1 Tax=Eragrostis curvula TaxID=38414 RepID=A0A5J9VBE1_9POAL|nr:hypothetical protein EJB05_24550 [Eragrostis curvula]
MTRINSFVVTRKLREGVGDNNKEASYSNIVWFKQANFFPMPTVYPNPPGLQRKFAVKTIYVYPKEFPCREY